MLVVVFLRLNVWVTGGGLGLLFVSISKSLSVALLMAKVSDCYLGIQDILQVTKVSYKFGHSFRRSR